MYFLKEVSEINDVEILTEGEGLGKSMFIRGIFAQAELKNRNNRIYPRDIMESAVSSYKKGFVDTRRALGELSHPDNRPTVKPELACHLITELHMDGNNVIGKAKVLNTPQGQIVKGLLEGGVQLGVSTRGLGSIKEHAGTIYVQNDFAMMAVDVVSDPSGINCFVDPLFENVTYEMLQDGTVLQLAVDKQKKRIDEATALAVFTKFMKSFK